MVTVELARLARETAAGERFAEYRNHGKGKSRRAEPTMALAVAAAPSIDREPTLALNGPPPASRSERASNRLPPQLQSDRGWFIEVVGEASYQREIEAAARLAKPYEGHQLIVVSLQPEDDNPHDPNAVRVDHRGDTLGYLPRAVARQYRDVLGGRAGALTASIFGGDGDNEDDKPRLYGIWLNAKWPPEFKT